MRWLCPTRFALLAWLAASLCDDVARADVKRDCADSYEAAQEYRRAGRLLLSRAQLDVCVQACPHELRQDCSAWRSEVAGSIASVLPLAQDSQGRAVAGVRLVLVDQQRELPVDGSPVELDPGQHRLRFERGDESIERTVHLAPGARDQEVVVVFASATGSAPEVEPEPTPPTAAAEPDSTGPDNTLAYVLGGIGLVGLAVGGAFGLSGHLQASDLRDSCAPTCEESAVDEIRTQWLIGGIAAATGVVALGTAIVVYDGGLAPADHDASTRGLRLTIGGSF